MLSSIDQTARGARSAVVMGCGRIGTSVAVALVERGCAVRVLDVDSAAFDLLPPGTVEAGQIVPVVGDGTLESDLKSASVQDADVFVAVAGKDSFNALAAQLAKHILQVPTVICRKTTQRAMRCTAPWASSRSAPRSWSATWSYRPPQTDLRAVQPCMP